MPHVLHVIVDQIPSLTLTDGSAVIGRVLAAHQVLTYTVPVGANVATGNAGLDVRGYTSFTLLVPGNFDGSVINAEVNHDGGATWYPLYGIDGSQVQVGSGVAVAGRAYDLPGELGPVSYLRFNCVTAQATTDTVFTLMMNA